MYNARTNSWEYEYLNNQKLIAKYQQSDKAKRTRETYKHFLSQIDFDIQRNSTTVQLHNYPRDSGYQGRTKSRASHVSALLNQPPYSPCTCQHSEIIRHCNVNDNVSQVFSIQTMAYYLLFLLVEFLRLSQFYK